MKRRYKVQSGVEASWGGWRYIRPTEPTDERPQFTGGPVGIQLALEGAGASRWT